MYKLIYLVLAIALGFAVSAQAAEGPSENSGSSVREPRPERLLKDFRLGDTFREVKETRERLKGELDTAKETFKAEREAVKETFKAEREAIKDTLGGSRADLKAAIEERKQAFKETLDVRKGEMKRVMQERKAALKERIGIIKDEAKQKVVLRVDERLGAINEQRTTFFVGALDRLDAILVTLTERADALSDQGVDTSAVMTRIDEAAAAIATARDAVSEQARRDYTLSINEESTVRADVEGMRNQLRTDLTAVRDAVVAARDAVKAAAVELRSASAPESEAPAVEDSASTN